MTDAERAVIDAARAAVAHWPNHLARHHLGEQGVALLAAVRALPRPLSELLVELRVGAVVEAEFGVMQFQAKVLDNDARLSRLRLQYNLVILELDYSDVTRIISNPEADRG